MIKAIVLDLSFALFVKTKCDYIQINLKQS